MSWTTGAPFGVFYDPLSIFDDLHGGISRAFNGSRGRHRSNSEFPAVNLWTGKDRAYLTAEIPGIALDNLDLSVLGNSLTIKGKKPASVVDEDSKVFKQERTKGEFSRTLELPFAINANEIEAQLKNGVLLVTLPRAEADKPKRLTIKSS